MKHNRLFMIKDIAEVQTGPFGSQLHNKDYVAEGTPIVTVEHLGGKRFSTQNLPCVSDEDKERLSKYSLQKGDIVFSRVGSVDRCSFVSEEETGWLFSGRCLRVRPNSRMCIPEYLYYYLCSPRVKEQMRNIAVGATMPSINTKLLCEIPVSCPEIETQKRIAQILSSLDDKIEVNNQINQSLEEQAFSFYNNLINETKQQCELNSVAVLNPVRSLPKGSVALCIDMAQLSTSSAYPNPGIYKSYGGGMKFQNGDTLLARITPCLENGKTAYIDFLKEGEIAFGSTEYIVLSSRGEMPPQFFYCLARDKRFRDYAIKHMNGSSGRQRVSADALAKYMIPSISKEDMRLLGQNVEPLFKLMRQKADENIRLSSLRDTLLPKLISGEINI